MKRTLARLPVVSILGVLVAAAAAGQVPGSGATAAPASGSVSHKIRLTYRGISGPHATVTGECPGAPTTSSTDVFEGVVTGDVERGLRAGIYTYHGDLVRKTDLDFCDLKPAPDVEWRHCIVHLKGHGVMTAKIEVETDRPTGYVTLTWKGKTATVDSASGNCESSTIAETRQSYLDEDEGSEFTLLKKGPLRDGETYIQPSRGPGDPVGPLTVEILGSKKLRADPGGPYQVVRGRELVLDGSRSEGDIVDYTWRIAARECKDAMGRPVSAAVELHGERVRIRPLCPIEATLEVKDATDSDGPKAARVAFSARAARTAVGRKPGMLMNAKLVAPCGCELGRNICAVEYGPAGNVYGTKSEHYFHLDEGATSYDTVQYDLASHSDPSGLFDGWLWVSTPKLKLERAELVNVLLTSATLEKENQGDTADDLALLVASVKEHEAIHSELIERGVRSLDPAEKVETLFLPADGDRDLLRRCADSIISQSDGRIRHADSEQAVIDRMSGGPFDVETFVNLRDSNGPGYLRYPFRTPATESDQPPGQTGGPPPSDDWAPCSALSARSIPSSNAP